MAFDVNEFLSEGGKCMKPSPIRMLLNVIGKPGVISFAGGLPNPLTFPIEDLKVIMAEVLEEKGAASLQYGSTDGDVELREELVKRYNAQGMNITKENVIVMTSSQQSIDLTTKIFVNWGDTVLCDLPSYLGALGVFESYGANIVGVDKYSNMEGIVKDLVAQGKKPKFMYTLPDFKNPSGTSMSIEERNILVEVARKYDIIIVEDTPYREVRFEGEHLPLVASLAPERTILFGSFSKTFVPGFRIGWLIATPEVVYRYNLAKQSADLCAPTFNQMVAAKYLSKGYLETNLKKTIELYRGKRDLMLECLEKYMPEGVEWTHPNGGLFLFITLKEGYDAKDLFDLAIKDNVAIVIGQPFFCDGTGANTFRVNFSYVVDELLDEGVKRLAKAIKEMYAKGL